MTYSFQDSPGSKFGPPIENEKNRILNVQLIYMGYAACETLQSLGLLLFLFVIMVHTFICLKTLSLSLINYCINHHYGCCYVLDGFCHLLRSRLLKNSGS